MRVAVLAAVLLVPLAGCADETGPPAPAPAPVEAPVEGAFAAFRETNRTEEGLGGLAHRHDYWDGKDRVVLLDGRFEMTRLPTATGVFADLIVPDRATVLEGTSSLEVLIDMPERHACHPSGGEACTDRPPSPAPGVPDPAPPKVRLEVLDAAAAEHADVGELVWGEPFVLDVAPERTDMPHSLATRWAFRVRAPDAASTTLTLHAVVTLVRGAEVALWPGHPDFYAEGHARVVLDRDTSTREGSVGGFVLTETSRDDGAPEKLVSHGTRAVTVWANVSKVTTSATATVTSWWLAYHNATGRWTEATPLSPVDAEARELVFVVSVDEEGMDSPYAETSRWRFVLYARTDSPANAATCGGCAAYTVDYHVTGIATDLPPPEGS